MFGLNLMDVQVFINSISRLCLLSCGSYWIFFLFEQSYTGENLPLQYSSQGMFFETNWRCTLICIQWSLRPAWGMLHAGRDKYFTKRGCIWSWLSTPDHAVCFALREGEPSPSDAAFKQTGFSIFQVQASGKETEVVHRFLLCVYAYEWIEEEKSYHVSIYLSHRVNIKKSALVILKLKFWSGCHIFYKICL